MTKPVEMISTSIIVDIRDNYPVEFELEGLARDREVAIWLFRYCGWEDFKETPTDLPHLFLLEPGETIEISEEEAIEMGIDPQEYQNSLFVLGVPLYLN